MEVKTVSRGSWHGWQLGVLPRELWMAILGRAFLAMNIQHFLRLYLVNSCWPKMVYESVTALEGEPVRRLADLMLMRLVSLQALSFPPFRLGSRKVAITDAGLRTATNLTKLDIANARWIRDDGIARLENLTWLKTNASITDIGLMNLTNLTALYLPVKICVTDESITNLTKLTTLESWDTDLTPSGLNALTNLTSLALGSTQHNFDGAVVRLPNLVHLIFGSGARCNISDDGLKYLTNLTHLDLSNDSWISDLGIQNLTKLQTLCLADAYNRVTSSGVSQLVNLTKLDISGMNLITDYGIRGLEQLLSLTLDIDSKVTDEGISNLINLTFLSLNDLITDAGISPLTNLTKLDLRGNRLVTESLREKFNLYFS